MPYLKSAEIFKNIFFYHVIVKILYGLIVGMFTFLFFSMPSFQYDTFAD